MSKYIKNPKTDGSGIICCIPQKGTCPMRCSDCFFQSGRSYLEPLDENLPNMPSLEESHNMVVRVNDGNDSNNQRELVLKETEKYPMRFYNTSIPTSLHMFKEPVVLTVNPGILTDKSFHKLDPIPPNLMFVRVRTNTWNLNIIEAAVEYYTSRNIPVVLTFMAYYTESIPKHSGYPTDYIFRKRTLNSYNAIKSDAWERIMDRFKWNKLVYSCGTIEGEKGDTHCKYCGNCLREYFSTKEKLKNMVDKK